MQVCNYEKMEKSAKESEDDDDDDTDYRYISKIQGCQFSDLNAFHSAGL